MSILEKFNNLLGSTNKPIFTLFGAEDWCRPCKLIAPHFQELSDETNNIVFVKVDMDSALELATEYQVDTLPCLLIFVNGKLKDRMSGGLNRDKISDMMRKFS